MEDFYDYDEYDDILFDEPEVDLSLERKRALFNILTSYDTKTDVFLETLKEYDAFNDINWHPEGESPLLFYPRNPGDPVRVKALIERGIDVNALGGSGGTIFGCSMDPDILEMMIAAKADVNFVNPRGESILETYATGLPFYYPPSEMMPILVDAGADIQPLFDSLYVREFAHDRHEIIGFLLERGYDVDLERTIAYRLLHNQIEPHKIPRSFKYGHLSDYFDPEAYATMSYKDYLKGAGVCIDKLKKEVEELRQLITSAKKRASDLKQQLSDSLSLSTDVSFMICKTLYQYTDY